MKDDFFQDQNQTTETAQEETPIETIKVGEKEYTQDQLQRLVGLGEIGAEAEEKYKTKIDKVWPKYQQVINEKRELEERLNQQSQQVQTQTSPTGQLTPEQIKAEAIRQAEELGIGPQAVRKTVMEVVQGQQLINETTNIIDEMKSQGLPSTTVEDIIQHMQDTGIRNPEKAYKDMFEKEYIASQAAKLAEIKPKGVPTITESVAGSKNPAPVRVTKDNLEQLVSEALASI